MHVHDVTADWADLSAVPEAMSSWAHNGIAVTAAGELIGFHAGQLVDVRPERSCLEVGQAWPHRGTRHHLGAGGRRGVPLGE